MASSTRTKTTAGRKLTSAAVAPPLSQGANLAGTATDLNFMTLCLHVHG